MKEAIHKNVAESHTETHTKKRVGGECFLPCGCPSNASLINTFTSLIVTWSLEVLALMGTRVSLFRTPLTYSMKGVKHGLFRLSLSFPCFQPLWRLSHLTHWRSTPRFVLDTVKNLTSCWFEQVAAIHLLFYCLASVFINFPWIRIHQWSEEPRKPGWGSLWGEGRGGGQKHNALRQPSIKATQHSELKLEEAWVLDPHTCHQNSTKSVQVTFFVLLPLWILCMIYI